MRKFLPALMALLVVHLQVANAACLCPDEDGHGHDHGHAHGPTVADHDDDHDDDHDAGPATSDEPGVPDDDHPSPHCECSPAQPYLMQDSAQLLGQPRDGGILPRLVVPPVWVSASVVVIGLSIWPQARPPPLVRGVSSTSPMSLSKLQI